ncbi:MAG: acyl-CoA synthetase FdrA [Hyphomicrobiaceae bacterium]
MSETVVNRVRKGNYVDSVALMRMSKSIGAMPEICEAALMMGTVANREILATAGLLVAAGQSAKGGDLIIAVRGATKESAERAVDAAEAQLNQPTTRREGASTWRPRSMQAALKSAPNANLALISVAGEFAVAEARKAIRQGLHAMIFSDNVPLGEEAKLKQEAAELNRLVMGPDCGTAIINGTPLAFANVVPRGNIGIVGASGTGTQEVSCLIAHYGGGISHAIGVGGRDLSSEVGGTSTLQALAVLAADEQTQKIVIVSKPPPADITAKVLMRVEAINKPVVICFIGADEMPMPVNAMQVFSLKAAARTAMELAAEGDVAPSKRIAAPVGRPRIHGLFSGGTLCAEAQAILAARRQAVCSNTPIPGVPNLDEATAGHVMLDLGDDEFTQGRPHPMIDPSVRDQTVVSALSDETVGVVLLDVVIGFGAHADPAGHIVACLMQHAGPDSAAIVASVTGTDHDPQVRSAQISKLEAAGVHVAPTNADASLWALSAISA